MRETPREAFVDGPLRPFAYDDGPLPIGEDQTISQPYIVALMIEAAELTSRCRVLDVGTGSGYAAAVMSRIAGRVFTIERRAALAQAAERRFRELGYTHIAQRTGDGTLGWPEEAPFDAIVVAAGGPVPPLALKRQLVVGGRLVMPIEARDGAQTLHKFTRLGDSEFADADLGAVSFVPLVGEQGWPEDRR